MDYTLEDLLKLAKEYKHKQLPIHFNGSPYTRNTIYRDDYLEIAVLCFSAGQGSSVHDHQGSNCVIRVVKGRMLEQLFKKNGQYLEFVSNHYLNEDDISGLDGFAIHQVSNMDKETVLLNFYSPPFII